MLRDLKLDDIPTVVLTDMRKQLEIVHGSFVETLARAEVAYLKATWDDELSNRSKESAPAPASTAPIAPGPAAPGNTPAAAIAENAQSSVADALPATEATLRGPAPAAPVAAAPVATSASTSRKQ